VTGGVRVFIACSLDGFIAGPEDDLSWLPGPDGSGEDYGFGPFLAETAAMLMGRGTYDVVARFDQWPYGKTPVFVATSRPLEPVISTVSALTGTPAELLASVRAHTGGAVYLDGGALIRSFLDEGLVDELTVTVVGVILGSGVPLFAGATRRHNLRLVSAVPYPSGLVQLRYVPASVDEPVIRVATSDDATAIDALMKESAAVLFPRYYDEQQAASALRYVARIDPMLLADGTYFVLESGSELVACGGWSRRDKLYTGSGDADSDARELDPSCEPARVRAMFVRAHWTRRGLGRRILDACETAARDEGFRQLSLVATLPGLPLYLAFGFQPVEEIDVAMPDGVTIACVAMEKPIGI
jgi:dihydrofolate reductase/GNAT superfamily N-acetyltransferase